MQEKINPLTRQLIDPIIQNMTAIYVTEQSTPELGATNTDQYKREKQECVHYIYENNQLRCMLYKTNDGKVKCKACGREVATQFDKTALDKLLDARAVVEQTMYFGMINNLNPDLVAGCIAVKKALPEIAQLQASLNEYVKREESNHDTVSNIGDPYRTPGITGSY